MFGAVEKSVGGGGGCKTNLFAPRRRWSKDIELKDGKTGDRTTGEGLGRWAQWGETLPVSGIVGWGGYKSRIVRKEKSLHGSTPLTSGLLLNKGGMESGKTQRKEGTT